MIQTVWRDGLLDCSTCKEYNTFEFFVVEKEVEGP